MARDEMQQNKSLRCTLSDPGFQEASRHRKIAFANHCMIHLAGGPFKDSTLPRRTLRREYWHASVDELSNFVHPIMKLRFTEGHPV